MAEHGRNHHGSDHLHAACRKISRHVPGPGSRKEIAADVDGCFKPEFRTEAFDGRYADAVLNSGVFFHYAQGQPGRVLDYRFTAKLFLVILLSLLWASCALAYEVEQSQVPENNRKQQLQVRSVSFEGNKTIPARS